MFVLFGLDKSQEFLKVFLLSFIHLQIENDHAFDNLKGIKGFSFPE